LGDVSGATVGAVAHISEASFPFSMILPLYPSILGQAIPSTFGPFGLAATVRIVVVGENIMYPYDK
jgi:hypothetical protein